MKRGLGTKSWFNPATFYWSVCTKPGKWKVVYMCFGGTCIKCSSLNDVLIGFGNVPTVFFMLYRIWNCLHYYLIFRYRL